MVEIRTDDYLITLLEKAKTIGQIPNPPLTAERFLVALIDEANNSSANSYNTEILLLLTRKVFPDLDFAKDKLLNYINSGNDTLLEDALFFNNVMINVKKQCAASGADTVDAFMVVMELVRTPTAPFAELLKFSEPVGKISDDWDDEDFLSDDELFPEDEESYFDDLFDEDESDADDHNPEFVKTKMAMFVNFVKQIRYELQMEVFGQDNAINSFVTGYFQALLMEMLEKSRRKPLATFLFAGPPGVGKTMLAESAAAVLDMPFQRFDMSEYADKEAHIEFCGSDNVYKNGKKGNVTSFVAENPKCILLFDEIEKAHSCVIHLFLQMLDAGRLRDNNSDEEVSFKDAIIIMTTNAGKQLYEGDDTEDYSNISRKVIINALKQDVNPATGNPFFPAAICSRFASGNVVMFNHIQAHTLKRIAEKEIKRLAGLMDENAEIEFEFDDRVFSALLLSEGGRADARTIKSRAATFFNDEIFELLRLLSSPKTKKRVFDLEKICVKIDDTNLKPEIVNLFEPKGRPQALVFADNNMMDLCRDCADICEFIVVKDVDSAVDIIKKNDIKLILIDMKCTAPSGGQSNLNIEDVESPARDFFKFLIEHNSKAPLFLLETKNSPLADEEKVSYARQGVRGIITLSKNNNDVKKQFKTISDSLHQQESINKLAKENKIVTFGTAQKISKSGKTSEITLFDFKLSTAVDANDAKDILSAVSKPDVHFDDVIGADDAKKELEDFIRYLKNPKKYVGTGVKPPKGVILYGPPGTGKTMLAKAMACEADVTFIASEGNQFLKSLKGEGADRVHALFRTARKYAPSILFIDEIDAIARERGNVLGAGDDETLTAFLTEMDGFTSDPTRPVFVLAATNFDIEPGNTKSLDPALMRRFDRRIYIDLPNKEDRYKFLKMKLAKNPALDISEEQLNNIAMRSMGMSLAQLDSAVELALRSAIRVDSTTVNDMMLEEAFETFNGGEVKMWNADQLERIACHEAGHAFLCWLGGEKPSYLTIVARGERGGYMQHGDEEGKAIYTKDELLSKIRVSLGGRAAEIVFFGEEAGVSTGASGDLASATNIAKKIVCTFGMDDDFGLAVFDGDLAMSGEMAREVRIAINRILKEQMEEAVRLLTVNKDKVRSLVDELLKKNRLTGVEIEQAITKGQ